MCRINFLIAFVLLSAALHAQTEGPNSPISANFSANGCLSCPGSEWTNYNNILAADSQWADVTMPGSGFCFQTACFYTRYLMAQNFGFSIPAGAMIDGIVAEAICRSAFGEVADTIVRLISSNQLTGNNNSSMTVWLPAAATITYGSSTDVWGATLTPDSVNHPQFGIGIMACNGSGSSDTAYVDHVQMTVYYSLSTGSFSQTQQAGNIFYDASENALLLPPNNASKLKSMDIIESTGKVVYHGNTGAGKKIVLPSLADGIYLAVIKGEQGNITAKFAVQRQNR
jgi:hypothetical protein